MADTTAPAPATPALTLADLPRLRQQREQLNQQREALRLQALALSQQIAALEVDPNRDAARASREHQRTVAAAIG